MRGEKPHRHQPARHPLRITPACAGKSITKAVKKVINEDHPRLRGEKYIFGMVWGGKKGSPPLARGKASLAVLTAALAGITPACAGKRPVKPFYKIFAKDHPRLRGEKKDRTAIPKKGKGITPACAGKRLKNPLKIKGF